jgi:peptide/nickel transport system substrate-binding protein
VANAGHHGGPPPRERVTLRLIPEPGPRVAALLAGDVQAIDAVPPEAVETLGGRADLRVVSTVSNRLIFLAVDAMRAQTPGVTDAAGAPLAANPLRDGRVRRALSLAINRDGIASQIMEGLADATDQPVPRAFFGALSDRTPAAQDIARARALLVEAGYPDGFGINLFCSPSRTPRICQAIAAAWTRVGVRTTVEVVPAANFLVRRNRREYGVFTTVFGSLTGESSYLLGSQIHTRNTVPSLGTLNFTGASFPELDRIIQTARATLDDTERARLLREVNQRVVDDAIIIPVVVLRSVAAGRANLAYRTRADEEILAAEITPR